jgi:16S rRNA (uracil1498-N3)-methyltransferase
VALRVAQAHCISAAPRDGIMLAVRHRFFVQDAGAPGTTVVLPADESVHAARVLRLRPGAAVGLFDGRGRELVGVVVATARARAVEVRIEADAAAVPEPRVKVTLAHAVLKGDKMDGVVRDAVMMGVSAIRPILTRHSETTLTAVVRGRRIERWQRVAIASAKQCGRAVVPDVLEPRTLATERLEPLALPAPWLVLAEPHAPVAHPVAPAAVPLPADGRATLIVGPEGGWAADEMAALEKMSTPVTLGPRTLRADIAALVAMSALFAVWGVDR